MDHFEVIAVKDEKHGQDAQVTRRTSQEGHGLAEMLR